MRRRSQMLFCTSRASAVDQPSDDHPAECPHVFFFQGGYARRAAIIGARLSRVGDFSGTDVIFRTVVSEHSITKDADPVLDFSSTSLLSNAARGAPAMPLHVLPLTVAPVTPHGTEMILMRSTSESGASDLVSSVENPPRLLALRLSPLGLRSSNCKPSA
ncbi:hypothetical protein C8R44DRAFT_879640 [Mycena epipterygia]|nr:hypothetical protein C8R44DRAFT_879640 [Mycena epipterygia]